MQGRFVQAYLSVASVYPRPSNISRAAQAKRQKCRCAGEFLGNALHKKGKAKRRTFSYAEEVFFHKHVL